MLHCLFVMNLGQNVCLDHLWVRFSKCYDTQMFSFDFVFDLSEEFLRNSTQSGTRVRFSHGKRVAGVRVIEVLLCYVLKSKYVDTAPSLCKLQF